MTFKRFTIPLLFLTCFSLTGCTSGALDLAPASPTSAYSGKAGEKAGVSSNKNFALQPDRNMPVEIATPTINPSHIYTLPELIDIAQLSNPVTRAAWQRAREAAAAVGGAEATYLPQLSAEVLAGYARTSTTAPGLQTQLVDVPSGTLTTSGMQANPALAVTWLLFDFGAREATVKSLQQLSFAANVTFNATHQKLIFDVSNAYYQYSAARAQTRINREALNNTKVVLTASKARLGQGIATTMEVAQAEQQVAQAEFDLTQASGRERNTYHHLLEAMGVMPTITIKVADISGRRIPSRLPSNLDALIVASLQQRPDVQAALARVKAGEQGVVAAQAEFLPKVAVRGSVSQNIGQYSVHDSRFSHASTLHANQPNAAILLGVSMPIFDGGLRASRMEVASAQAQATRNEFAQIQNAAAREVVVAYDTLQTSISAYRAANQLVKAANTNHEASLGYFRNGLATLADVSVAQTGLLKARYAQAEALSSAFSAAAVLAFATGQVVEADPR